MQLYDLKKDVQYQMQEKESLRQMAFDEYVKEREQVDQIINKMIQEDMEMMKLNKMKQEQSKQDMILSINEKRALIKRQQDLEQYEEELVRRYAQQQQNRANEIKAMKDAAEAQRDAIFNRLAQEEAKRRAQSDYIENLRNELQVEEMEERARAKEQSDAYKRQQQKEELIAAKEYQMKLKAEKLQEEKRMEQEFKMKMAQKFAEDDRLEQMNAQRRRMKELEHRREIERLWQERLAIYQAQREMEWEEKKIKEERERLERDIVEQRKQELLRQHADILKNFNPKASNAYGASKF